MKILYCSDIHENEEHLSTLLRKAKKKRVSAAIIGGDLIPKQRFFKLFRTREYNKLSIVQAEYIQNELVPAIRAYKRQHADTVFYLDIGNDDFFIARRPLETAEEEGLLRLLHMRKWPLTEEVDILGYMAVPPTPFAIKDLEKADSVMEFACSVDSRRTGLFTSPDGKGLVIEDLQWDETSTIEYDLQQLEKQIDKPFIFVCHPPPFGTALDTMWNGIHVGSRAVLQWIEKWGADGRLQASFHGHIHESSRASGKIVDYINGVPCFNPGQAELFQSYVFDLDDLIKKK